MLNEELLDKKTELDRTKKSLDLLSVELNKIIKKVSDGHQELQNIDKEKSEMIQKIYDEAYAVLSSYTSKVSNVIETLDLYYSDIMKGFSDIGKNTDIFIANIEKTKKKTDGLLEKSEQILTIAEQTKESIEEANKELEKKIINNSDFEKSLKIKEKELQNREKIAQDKLSKAEELVLWHKKSNIKITI